MNLVEVGALLTIASGFDRFIEADRVTANSWLLALSDVEFEDAKAAVVAHYTGPIAKEILGVRHILNAVKDKGRNTATAIEADVRSAKARGLIEKSWPNRDRLPEDVAKSLSILRERDRVIAETDTEIVAHRDLDIGVTLKRVQ